MHIGPLPSPVAAPGTAQQPLMQTREHRGNVINDHAHIMR
jgi:hypothetical protein